jgi:RNA polymerase sigma-70 factor (ECF subfamily)
LAEEISIITFARAFDRIATFNDQYKFKTWLLTISKNIYNDLLRKKNNKIILKTISNSSDLQEFSSEDHPSPEEILITNENLESLLNKIKSLNKDYRKILQLRFFEGLAYKEISKKMDQPINTIKVKLLRAKNLLNQKIEKDA